MVFLMSHTQVARYYNLFDTFSLQFTFSQVMMFCKQSIILVVTLIGFATVFSVTGEFENCTSDYETLERGLFDDRNNKFLLMTTFFPPHLDTPLYVTVTYKVGNTSVDYIWSTASLYLTLHPEIIRYLSLFFCYIETERLVNLELKLPEECSDLVSNTKSDATNFLYILTKRVS